jgi:hypothetical protein
MQGTKMKTKEIPSLGFLCQVGGLIRPRGGVVVGTCYKPESCEFETPMRRMNFSNLLNPSCSTRRWCSLSL